MEVSRLTFTKETKEKMKKDIPVREKGKVLFARLQELDADGTLSKAKTRADVARLVGYSEERSKAGYAWVSNLIRRGHLSEIIQEWTPSGKMIAEYHLTGGSPDYGYEEVNRRRAKKEAGQELRRWQDKVAAGYIPQAPHTDVSIKITRGDITIEVKVDGSEQASKLITSIMKGE